MQPASQPGFAAQPVHWLPGEAPRDPADGTGLCLSGGGYRAMLFHAGALARLNEAGLLPKLDRISSVSGGSITAAVLALSWDALDFRDGVARAFERCVVAPVRALAGHTLDVRAVLEGALLPHHTISDALAGHYDDLLFKGARLTDLPGGPGTPLFIFNATNLETGNLWRFTREYMADWQLGRILAPDVPLAQAVAASSAFPPVLSPCMLDLRGATWAGRADDEFQDAAYRDRIALSDGGVYDNLGLETVWKRCRTVFVSDAGGALGGDPDPHHDWILETIRVLHVIDNQVRDLRKHQAIAGYLDDKRAGTFWGIRSHTADYELADALPCPPEQTLRLAQVATRLDALDDRTQERLINWGYAICDTALRRWIDTGAPRGTFPYPASGVGTPP